jgi:hypothetical protein
VLEAVAPRTAERLWGIARQMCNGELQKIFCLIHGRNRIRPMWDGCTVANGRLPIAACGSLGVRAVRTPRVSTSTRREMAGWVRPNTQLGGTVQLGWPSNPFLLFQRFFQILQLENTKHSFPVALNFSNLGMLIDNLK